MKRTFNVVLLFTVCALILSVFCGCSNSKSEAGANVNSAAGSVQAAEGMPEELRFVLVPKVVHPWYDAVKNGAEEAAAFLTKTTGTKVVIDWAAPVKADVALHTNTIEQAIATKPDGLAIAVLDSQANTPQIIEAQKRGIATLVFDSLPPEGTNVTAIGTDYYKDGYTLGKKLAEDMGGKGDVGLLLGFPTAPNHKQRVDGIKAALAEYPGIKIVGEANDNDSIDVSVKAAGQLIAAHPSITGMVGPDAAAPIGIGIAIKEANKVGKIKLVGLADLDEIIEDVREGVASCTLVHRTRQIGWWLTMCMFSANTGGDMPAFVDAGTFMVYPEDVDTFKDRL